MSPRLFLLENRFVALGINIVDSSLSTHIEEELGLIKVFLLTGEHIESGQRHLGNLMTRNHTSLSRVRSNLTNHTVGIAFGDVQELVTPCSLIMGTSSIHHMSQVVELMTQHLYPLPPVLTSPAMRMVGIDGAGSIEITIRLLSCSHDIQYRVDIVLQTLVRIGLQHIAGPFDGLIHIGIIKRETHELSHIPLGCFQSRMSRMLQGIGSHLEVLVTMLTLAFAERQRDGHLTGSLDTLSPEGIRHDLYCRERNLTNRIAVVHHIGFLCPYTHYY